MNCMCDLICVHESYLVNYLLEFSWFLIRSYANIMQSMQIKMLVYNYKIVICTTFEVILSGT